LIADQKFSALQNEIFQTFGQASPSAPVLRCRNATQTSIVLEWDPIELATADLRSLSLYRNGTKAGVIPRDKLSTKISGLALDTEYTFHLVLRTSAGQYSSEKLTVKTHKMTDLSGITITPGVMPGQLRDSLAETVNRIGAKLIDTVRIDTTHFVCTEPRGQAWEKAVEMNVPVVVPDWVKGCEREGKLVGVRGYYLDADPKHRQMGPSSQEHRGSVSSVAPQQSGPRIEHTPPTPEQPRRGEFDRQDASQAPTPPPKPVHERIAEAEEEDQPSASGTPATTQQDTQVSPVESDDEDSEDTEQRSEDPEKAAAAREAANVSPVSPTGGPADGDEKFDEVAL
jgi:hypothetical protein